MAQSLMLKSLYAEFAGGRIPIIVDLGYLTAECGKDTIARAEAIMATGLISRRNFRVEGFSRLLVELPPTKAASILGRFPIVEGETYWRSTHHWRGLATGEA